MHSSAPAHCTSRCIYINLRDYLQTNSTHKMMLIDSYTMESRARERIYVQQKSTVCKIKSAGKFLLYSQRKSSGVQHSRIYFQCVAHFPCSSVWSGHEPCKEQNWNLFILIFLGALSHISPFNPVCFQVWKQNINRDFLQITVFSCFSDTV